MRKPTRENPLTKGEYAEHPRCPVCGCEDIEQTEGGDLPEYPWTWECNECDGIWHVYYKLGVADLEVWE